MHQRQRCFQHNWETARVLQALVSAKQGKAQVLHLLKRVTVKQGCCWCPDHTQDWGCTCALNQTRSKEMLGNQPTVTSWKNKVTADKQTCAHMWQKRCKKPNAHFSLLGSVIQLYRNNSSRSCSARQRPGGNTPTMTFVTPCRQNSSIYCVPCYSK